MVTLVCVCVTVATYLLTLNSYKDEYAVLISQANAIKSDLESVEAKVRDTPIHSHGYCYHGAVARWSAVKHYYPVWEMRERDGTAVVKHSSHRCPPLLETCC